MRLLVPARYSFTPRRPRAPSSHIWRTAYGLPTPQGFQEIHLNATTVRVSHAASPPLCVLEPWHPRRCLRPLSLCTLVCRITHRHPKLRRFPLCRTSLHEYHPRLFRAHQLNSLTFSTFARLSADSGPPSPAPAIGCPSTTAHNLTILAGTRQPRRSPRPLRPALRCYHQRAHSAPTCNAHRDHWTTIIAPDGANAELHFCAAHAGAA